MSDQVLGADSLFRRLKSLIYPKLICYISLNMSGHFHDHNSRSLAYTLSQLNPFHALLF
jgi:hypothetical protein